MLFFSALSGSSFIPSGSFKVRGVLNQLANIPEGCGSDDRKLLSFSAGNYGKSFAFLTRELGLKGLILMPDTAPEDRARLIQVIELLCKSLQCTLYRSLQCKSL